MIIWLASYPRSGNSLLRTILHSTMGLLSYDQEKMVRTGDGLITAEYSGSAWPPAGMSWPDFYQQAKESPETHFIKTHFPPADDQPAIYVVRDGRLATWSYLAFHQSYDHMPDVSLQEIILGYNRYGNWSTHYRAWTEATQRPLLVLRYEELVNIGMEKLQEIAAFIKRSGPVNAWENPFPTLQQLRGKFFREGNSLWQRPDGWTDYPDDVFRVLHGPLMQELGYLDAAEVAAPLASIAEHGRLPFEELVRSAAAANIHKAHLEDRIATYQTKLQSLKTRTEAQAEQVQNLKTKLNELKAKPVKKSFLQRLGLG